jgi:hypothetical protein
MNYYEELGVRHDATIEDIRQAYKLTARLLHPDRQLDPRLKQIADRQMKRLGGIVDLLTDPETRAHYDDVLLMGNRPDAITRMHAIPPPAAERWQGDTNVAALAGRYWFWVVSAAFVVILGAWSFVQPVPAVPGAEWRGETAAPRDFDSQHPPARTARGALDRGSDRRPSAPAGRFPFAERTRAPGSAPEPHPTSVPEVDPPVVFALPQPAHVPELAALSLPASLPPLRKEASFAGRWLYSPRPGEDPAERGVYPATYIELLLVEHGADLAGDYHAVYKVYDQTVSPDIAFQIHGSADSATSAKFAWATSTDTARGRAEMTLRSPNILHVSWWTTAFGRQNTLGSGAGLLIRQQAP